MEKITENEMNTDYTVVYKWSSSTIPVLRGSAG